MDLADRLSELRADLPAPFSVDVRTSERETIVAVEGELDRGNVAAVRRVAHDASSRPRSLILNLSTTTFVDSAGLHLIYELAARQRKASAPQLVVTGVSRRVQRTLDLAPQPDDGCDPLIAAA